MRNRRRSVAIHPPTTAEIAGYTPFGWFRQSTLAGLANGAACTSWTDSAGVVGNATQATGAQQPTMDTAGINSKRALRFTASTNTCLVTPSFTGFTGCAIFVVCRTPTGAPAGNQYTIGHTAAPGQRRDVFYNTDRSYGMLTTGGNFVSTTVEPLSTPSVVTAIFNDTSSLLRVDGVPTSGTVASANPTQLLIGNRGSQTEGFDGWIGEIIYFSTLTGMTAARIARIERYLEATWAIVPSQPGVAYCDSVTGSDTANSGRSKESPFLTLAKGKTFIGGLGQMYLKAPVTTPFRELLENADSTGVLNIASVDTSDAYIFGSTKVTSGWSATAGGVYSQTLTLGSNTPTMVMVATLTQTYGDRSDLWYRLLENTSTPTTPAAGEFGVVGSVVYVHLPAGVNPNSHTLEVPVRNNCITSRGTASKVGVKRIQHWCGVIGGLRVGVASSTNATITAEDGGAAYCGSTGGFAAGGTYGPCKATRFVSFANQNDGFNIHGDTGESSPVTVTDCDGGNNWDEGASNHDDTVMILVRGRMHSNGSGGMTAVNNARCDILGTEIDGNQVDGVVAGEGAVTWRDSTNTGSLDGAANVHDNHGPGIVIGAGARVTVGTYTSTGNAQADTGL